MEEQHGISIFKTVCVSRANETGCLVLMFAALVCPVFFLIAFLLPKEIAWPWPVWAAIFFAIIIYGWYFKQRLKVTIQLFKKSKNEMVLRINKAGNKTFISFAPSEVSNWHFIVRKPVKNWHHHAYTEIAYYCLITGTDGREISFQKMIVEDKPRSLEWPFKDLLLTNKENLYEIENIFGFVDCINKNKF
jgi:hypothetical protein